MSRNRVVIGLTAVIASLALTLVAAGCGSDSTDSGTGGPAATVFAAASLTDVFPQIVPGATYNFAASDTLATQIREGAPADVYAAANEKLPNELSADGLVEKPAVFATNRLVIVVRAGNPKGITKVSDLNAPGVTFVMADEGVPVGDYTRKVLDALGRSALVGKAASQEDDVRSVVGKVALGEAEAGFAYATDAIAADEDVDAVEIPADAQPPIHYGIAVVTAAKNNDAAQAFVDAVLSDKGRAALQAAGFGVP
jgi:molybdate transport system substrate-binding protein